MTQLTPHSLVLYARTFSLRNKPGPLEKSNHGPLEEDTNAGDEIFA
jgi:hypothetical protein